MLKYIAIHIVRFLLTVFYVFPINKKKIFFSSFNGKKYFCNPKYIFLDLYKKKPQLKYVWCLNQYCAELSENVNVVKVKYKTLLWIYHLLTAKVIIFNTNLDIFMPYRKSQVIINTWHGGGAYKRVAFAIHSKKNDSYINKKYWREIILRIVFNTTTKYMTYFISSGKVFSDVMHESYHIPYIKYFPVGMPRNDIFFKNNDDLIFPLKNYFNIPLNNGVVLYAPTFRGVHSYLETQAVIKLDIDRLKLILKEKFKKEYICLFRGHPSLLNNLYCDDAINVSSYDDMQELLLIADVLITDYSSSIWDFSLTKKPCFLFTPDLDLYLSHDRGFYTPIEEWPYPFARTNEELCNNIINFDKTIYEAKIKKHHEDLGSYEQGTASQKVTKLLQEIFK